MFSEYLKFTDWAVLGRDVARILGLGGQILAEV